MVGILHASVAPVVSIGGVHPSLLVVATVLATVYGGLEVGLVTGFVAGLVANLLVTEPLGSLPLAMLLVAVLVAFGLRPLGRLGWLYPVVAAFAGSLTADATGLAVHQLVGDPLPVGFPIALLGAAAALNAAITAAFAYPTRALFARAAGTQRPEW